MITAVYPPDGSSNGTISIWSASSGPIAIFDMPIRGGVMLVLGVFFVCANSNKGGYSGGESWEVVLFAALLDSFSYARVFSVLPMVVLNEFIDQLSGK